MSSQERAATTRAQVFDASRRITDDDGSTSEASPEFNRLLWDGTHRMSKSAHDPDDGHEPETVKVLPGISTLTSRAQHVMRLPCLRLDFRADCWF